MQNYTTLTQTFYNAFLKLWENFLAYIPWLLGVIAVLIIGIIIAAALGRLAKKIIDMLKIDQVIRKTGLSKKMSKMGLKFSVSEIIGWLVKWFFILVTLIAVVQLLNLTALTNFLIKITLYIPDVLIAIIILAIGIIIGHFIYEIVEKSTKASNLPKTSAKPLAALAKWSIIIVALMAALVQLGIAYALVQTFFTGLVAMVALAGGLAFGLGGKDMASKLLEKTFKEFKK
jgi:hypothetical protein